jgi:hypothetical protein
LTFLESFPGGFNVQLGLSISALHLATNSYILKHCDGKTKHLLGHMQPVATSLGILLHAFKKIIV